MNNPLLNALNGAQAQPVFPVAKPAKPQTPAQRQRMLNQTMQGPTVSPLQRAMMPNVAPVRRDTTPPALRVLPEYDFHRIAYGAENEQEKRDIMRREALTRRSNPNSLESVMASVDKRLGTKQGDEVRELIKSFAWIRSGGINRGGLKAYVDEGIKRFETQGIDSLRSFVETGRRYRDVDPTPREGDDPELARAQYLKQSALQAQADLREGTPADARQGVIDTGSSPQFGDALATGVYNTNPLGMIGQGIRNIQEMQAGKAPTVAMASEYGQNLAVDKPHMGEDPGLIALGVFNDFLAPASRAYRQTMGPVSSANEGTQLGLQIGDFVGQIAVAAALPQTAAQGIAKLPEIGARFAAMDLPQYGEMVAASKGNAGKAATDFMEATFGQFAHAPKLMDPKVPWAEKGHIALGMLQGSLLLAGALAGKPNGKHTEVIATQAKDAMETSMRFLGENADNPEVQAGIAQAINEPAPKPSPFSAEDANPFQKAPKGQKAPKVQKEPPPDIRKSRTTEPKPSPEQAGVSSSKPRVFHGTAEDFNGFDPSKRGNVTGAKSAQGAFWFVDNERVARAYATHAAEDGPTNRLMREADEAEKVAQKTGDWTKYDALTEEIERVGESNAAFERRKNAIVKEIELDGDFYEVDAKGKTPQELSSDGNIDSWLDAQVAKAKRLGKAGVKITNLDDGVGLVDIPATHYAVFDPKSIKELNKWSATGERPTPTPPAEKPLPKEPKAAVEPSPVPVEAKAGAAKDLQPKAQKVESPESPEQAQSAVVRESGNVQSYIDAHKVPPTKRTPEQKKLATTSVIADEIKAKARPFDYFEHEKGWLSNKVNGETWFTNTHFAFKGEPPAPPREGQIQPNIDRVLPKDVSTMSPLKVEGAIVSGRGNQKGTDYRTVMSNADGVKVYLDPDYIALAKKQFGDNIEFRASHPDRPIAVVKDGEMVGVIMPMSSLTPDVDLRVSVKPPKRTAQTKAELAKAFDDFKAETQKLGARRSPEQQAKELELTINLAKKAVAHGIATVEEFIQAAANHFGTTYTKAEQAVFRKAWEQVQPGQAERLQSPQKEGYTASNRAAYDAWKKQNPDAPEYTAKGTSAEAAWHKAKSDGLFDKADEIIADITKNKRGASAEEEMAIAQRSSDLASEIKALTEKRTKLADSGDMVAASAMDPQIDVASNKLADAMWASRVGGTAWHNSGMARQLWLKTADGATSFAYRLSKKTGRKLTAEETQRISSMGAEHERLSSLVAELESQVVKLAAKATLAERVSPRASRTRTVSAERAKQALKELGAFEPVVGSVPMPSSKQLKAWSDIITYAYESTANPTIDAVTSSVKSLVERNKIAAIPDETIHKIIVDQYKLSHLEKGRLLSEVEAAAEARAISRQNAVEAFAPDRRTLSIAKKQIEGAGANLDVDAAISKIAIEGGVSELDAAMALKKAIAGQKGSRSRKIGEMFGGDDEIRRLVKQSPELRDAYAKLQKERIHLSRLGNEASAYISKVGRETEWKNAGAASKLWIVTKESQSLLRTVLTTLDNSIPLRQGFVVLTRNPKIWAEGFANSWRSIGKNNHERVMDSVLNADPENTDLALASGLDIPTKDGKVEENYSSFIIQDTVVGKPFRWSERMANASMVTMRLNLFKNMVKGIEMRGEPISLAEAKELAQHINTITGRGKVGKQAEALSAVFLAPRFAKSRLDMVFGSVDLLRSREGMTPRVKKEVGRTLAQYYGVVTAAVLLAKFAGAKVEEDSRSADFLKAVFQLPGGNGEITLDLSGGAAGYYKMATRMALSLWSSATGNERIMTDKNPQGLKNRGVWEQGLREWVGKAAPVPGAIAVGGGALRDRGGTPRNILGQPTDMGRELTRTAVPIQVQSSIQNARENATIPEAALSFALEFLGLSSQYRGKADNRNQKAVYDVNPVADIKKAINK